MPYLLIFGLTMLGVGFITPLVRRFSLQCQVVDIPDEPRKIHSKPTPLLGGIAIWFSLVGAMWWVGLATRYFTDTTIEIKYLLGITAATFLLIAGGYLDDKYNLKPSRQIIFTIIASLIIIASGIGIDRVTNPFGGTLSLVWWEKVLFWWQGVGYKLTLPADLFTFGWLMLIMYTTKFLDGLDGLVSGITVIGALMIFFLATATKYFQPEVGVLSLIVAGAFVGFLFWNWHPAKIFLGTGGSTLAGFMLGTLAIVSGGKIATTLLVLAVPILDAIWIILRRIFWEHRSPTQADRKHLHFRLLDIGMSHRGAVIFLWLIAALSGMTTLFLQSTQKLLALLLLALLTAFLLAIGSVAAPLSAAERKNMQRRTILGVSVDSITLDNALAQVDAFFKTPGQYIITTPNPEMLVLAQRDPEFKAILNQAALALPDGIGLMLMARWLKRPLAERIPGSDFVWKICALAAEKGYSVYLLGGEQGVAQEAARQLKISAKGGEKLKIVGAEPGPKLEPLRSTSYLLRTIQNAAPDILLVAFGHGKQEKWITEHLPELLTVKVAMGVGGTFDFIAGQVQRAPSTLRLIGLEWFWRLLRQPWRLPRIWRAVVVFPWSIILEYAIRKRRG